MLQLRFKFYLTLKSCSKLLLAIAIFLINEATLADYSYLEAKICQKDLQVRMVTIKNESNKFITTFHKQEESLVSGRFDSLISAQESLVEVQIGLEKIGWKCRAADVSFIFE